MRNEQELKKILIDLGLTELQIRAYSAILKGNGIKISSLAKQIGVNRPNTYTLIEKLEELNLIYEENLVSGKVIYTQSFEKVIEALESKKKSFEGNINSAKTLKSFFDSLQNSSNSYLPKVRTFETKHSLNTIADDILSSSKGKEILLYSNQQTEKSFFSKAMHEKFVQTRIKNKTKIRVLAVDNKEGRDLKKSDKGLLRETKILPKNISFNSEIYIYDGKIAMIDVKDEVIGVIIENEELFNVHKQMFEMVWGITS